MVLLYYPMLSPCLRRVSRVFSYAIFDIIQTCNRLQKPHRPTGAKIKKSKLESNSVVLLCITFFKKTPYPPMVSEVIKLFRKISSR
jgi:hypothetical protein